MLFHVYIFDLNGDPDYVRTFAEDDRAGAIALANRLASDGITRAIVLDCTSGRISDHTVYRTRTHLGGSN